LKGIKAIEKTSEHIDIIRLLIPKRLLVKVQMGMKAICTMQLATKAKKCPKSTAHLYL
jgi:hypothetical protein